MNKQELIHLHGLAVELARYCETEGDLPVDLRRYHGLGMNSHSIHQPKQDHREALFALVEEIASSLPDETPEPERAPARVNSRCQRP